MSCHVSLLTVIAPAAALPFATPSTNRKSFRAPVVAVKSVVAKWIRAASRARGNLPPPPDPT
jgi:hypothetical protein